MTDEQEKLEKMKKLYAEKYEQVLKDAYSEALLYGKGPLADVLGMNRTGMYGKGIVEELLEQHKDVKMTDIVEQIKKQDFASTKELEAANEIERLRAVMETVADALYDKGDYECWAALRNALWQDKIF